MRTIIVLLAALLTALPAVAQKKPDVTGGTVVTSEPGKAAAVRTLQVTAQVVALDKASRTVSLKGPEGNVIDVVAGDEVKNFAQIKVGDYLFVRYMQSLSLELQKVKAGPSGITEQSGMATAKPGERPAAAAGHEVTAIAKVTAEIGRAHV